MSLAAAHRDAILHDQEKELRATELRLDEHLKGLYRLTQWVEACKLAGGATSPPALDYAAPPTPAEDAFVRNNSIHRGHAFDLATLPVPFEDDAPAPIEPAQEQQDHQEQPVAAPSPSRARSPLSPISNPSRAVNAKHRASPQPVSLKHESNAAARSAVAATPTPPRSPLPSATDAAIPQPPQPSQDTSNLVDASNIDPRSVPIEQRKPKATLPGPGEGRPKVLHLPPKEQQEQHIREVERAHAAQRVRDREEDKHQLGLSVSVPAPDAVSSPSSTAGAYSNATPKPPQHSPDTSPDADYSHEERERLRQVSMEHANGQQKDDGPLASPGTQLRREEEQASQNAALNRTKEASQDRKSLDAGFAKTQLDLQTPRPPVRARRSDNLDIDMVDAPSAIVTPMQPPSTDGPSRRMTRVASGAMRQKSVSEILGETPRPTLTRRESVATSVDERERAKHSLVVFSKTDASITPHKTHRAEPDGYLALRGAQDDAEKDYLRPLFLHQAYQPPRATTLSDLIGSAHKTLTTTNMYANIREGFDYRILRRIYHLQNANKWAFRQMAKFPDPEPPTTHMDHLMAEMKWMRTDFREERKWKQAGASKLAKVCAQYVNSPKDVRITMRVKAKIPPRDIQCSDHASHQQSPSNLEAGDEPPELDHSGSTDSGESLDDEIIPFPMLTTVAPAALFNLGYDDVIFELDDTPAADGILQELPVYESKPIEPAPFGSAKNTLIPVSKYADGKLVPKPVPVLRKRSRYDYESEDEEPVSRPPSSKRRTSEVSMFLSPARRSPRRREIPPEATDVALFDPINRHIRDRLHANHAFRPPSEFAMPSTSFFEWRQNSQWTWDEDQKLRGAVKKFEYNWSVIGRELQRFTQPSIFVSAQERRTPWECFERWEQLEGLPNDMDKTAYFRTYRQRIQTANRAVEARAQAAQQLASQNGNTMAARRRTDTNPFRVQRRKDDRHMMMIGAITKLQKKRETHSQRQHESAKAAALRKQHNEANQPKNAGIHTPQEFSRMKHEREVKLQERQELYRQQMMQQQAAKAQAMQRQMQGQGQPTPQGMPNGTSQQQRVPSGGSQGPSPPAQMTNGQVNGNMQQRPTSQNMMQNGMSNGMPNNMNLQMPNGQMQNVSGQQRLPQNQQDLRMMMAQRQGMQYMQGQGNQQANLAAAHMGQIPQNSQMLAALAAQRNRQQQQQQMQGANGMNGMNGANSTSPRGPNTPGQQPGQLSSGHIPHLLYHQQQVQREFPSFSAEDVMKLANERLKGQMARLQVNALNAASGNNTMGQGMNSNHNNMAMPPNMTNGQYNQHANGMSAAGGSQSPTQYAQALQRNMQQQAAQAHARMGSGSPALGNVMPVSSGGASRSGTPQQGTPQQPQGQQQVGMQIPRPGSAMTGMGGEDGSPRMM